MNDAMNDGKKSAMLLIDQLFDDANKSGDPAMFWSGAIFEFCWAMAANAGPDLTIEALQYLADRILRLSQDN